jgi:CheY-like chemotaxis protein
MTMRGLPSDDDSSSPPSSQVFESKVLAGTSVLMVDDDPDGLVLLQFVVELAGATVRTAMNAHDALEALKSFRPDVMLLDISLPQTDGYALLKAIRQDPAMRSVPALAVTAHAFERDKQRAAEAGFSVHVSKPFDAEALVHLLSKLSPKLRISEDPPALRAFQAVLSAQGVQQALGFLNQRAPYRFTGIYRFDGSIRRNLGLFDRADPKAPWGDAVPLGETCCSIVETSRRPLVVTDAATDPRLADRRAHDGVRSYCGVVLRRLDGTPFGSLCHFDVVPVPSAHGVLDMLLHAAPLLAGAVADPESGLNP